MACAYSEDENQPAYPCRLIRLFVLTLSMYEYWDNSNAGVEDFYQCDYMCLVNFVFAVCTQAEVMFFFHTFFITIFSFRPTRIFKE